MDESSATPDIFARLEPTIGVGVGAADIIAGVGDAEAILALGESLIAPAVMGNGTGDLLSIWFSAGCCTIAPLLRDEVDAVLKAGLAAGVSKIEAIGLRGAGVLLTLPRGGSTGLSEPHWLRIGVSRWFVEDKTLEELSCQLRPSLPSGLLSSVLLLLLLRALFRLLLTVVLMLEDVPVTRSVNVLFWSLRSSNELLLGTAKGYKVSKFACYLMSMTTL